MVWAQLPAHHCGDPGYLYSPACGDRVNYYIYGTGSRAFGGFSGSGFTAHHDTVVYGVAVPSINLDQFPYLWVYLLKARLADSVTLYGYNLTTCDSFPVKIASYSFETARRELYCFMDRPPVPYAEMEFPTRGEGNVVTCPVYDFYFEPCGVDSGDLYFVGIVQSEYNVYNHYRKDAVDNYWPSALIWSVRGGMGDVDYICGVDINGFPDFNNPVQFQNDTGAILGSAA